MNFRIWGKYTDDTLFDESFDTWADLTVFKNTLKETGKEISISSKEGIDEELLPTSLAWFLSDFLSMEECDISALNTSMVTTMDRVFYNTYNSGTTRGRLKKLDLSKNNLSRCKSYAYLLYNQQYISYADLSSLNFEIIVNISNMCQVISPGLTVVLPKNMYAPLLTAAYSAFRDSKSFTNIEAFSTFNTKFSSCNLSNMFGSSKITNLDLSSLELLPTMNVGAIFVKSQLTEVLCKDQASADLLMGSSNKPANTQCYVKEPNNNLSPEWLLRKKDAMMGRIGVNLLDYKKASGSRFVGSFATILEANGIIKGTAYNYSEFTTYPRIINDIGNYRQLVKDEKYVLSFWGRAEKVVSRGVSICRINGSNALFRSTASYTTEWQKFEFAFTAAYDSQDSSTLHGATNVEWYCGTSGQSSNSSEWLEIKDVKLERGNKATPWCPSINDMNNN